MKRSSMRWLVGVMILLVLIIGGVTFLFWLKAAKLKEAMVAHLGEAIGAHVTVTSLDFNLWSGELHAAGISLVNDRPEAPWDKGAISQATIHFKLSDIFSRNMPLTVEVSSWSVVLHAYSAIPAGTPSRPAVSESIHVTAISARDGEVDYNLADSHQVVITGVEFESSDNGAGVWTTSLQTGSIKADTFAADSSSVQIRGDKEKVSFTDLRMPCQSGIIMGEGSVKLTDDHTFHATLKATDIPISLLVAVPWQVKLTGLVNGSLIYDGDDKGGGAQGQFSVNHGKFNILPWLGKVTTLVGLPDISDVEVDKATSSFDWKAGTLHLSSIDVRKTGVSSISGEATINPDGQIDGKLKLGLPATVLVRWPQLQQKIFTDTHDDFSWTEVHITGTPDHLQEDLTARLLTVGMQQGNSLINDTSQKALDLLNGFLK